MKPFALRAAMPTLLGACLAAAAAPAGAVTRITPYIEVQQVLDVPLSGSNQDVLTYTALAAGVDASASGHRVNGTISYRYEHQIPWNDHVSAQDVHSGLARASIIVSPDLLTMEVGGIATRTRADIRGDAPSLLSANRNNITQVYGGYIGPSLKHSFGDLDVAASYRFGYVKADNDYGLSTLPAGQPQLDAYDHSSSHTALASVGMAPGPLPVGWTITGSLEHEDAQPLSQRFDNRYVRGELTLPVSGTVALTAAVGYEDIKTSQSATLLDSAGNPVIDSGGHYVADHSQPRQIAYNFDGLLYDVGVIWKPSSRTTLIAKVGRRYGKLAVTGSFQHQFDSASGVQVVVYNSVDSFGRSLTNGLSGLPTQFSVPRTGFANSFDGCVFGSQGTGGCLNDAFQSLNTANYRSRGVTALYSAQRGGVSFGIGAGYDERKYLGPAVAQGFSIDGVTDREAFAQANLSFPLGPRSTLSNQIYVAYYRSGIANAPHVLSGGVVSSYLHNFTDRLSGNASAGLYASDQEGFETDLTAQFLLGARYQF